MVRNVPSFVLFETRKTFFLLFIASAFIFFSSTVADVSSDVFWRTQFSSLCDHRQLTEFYVLHVEPTQPHGEQPAKANLSEKVSEIILLALR